MGLVRYLARRFIFVVFLLIGVSFFVFVLSNSVPGDPTVAFLSSRNLNNEEMVRSFREKWGMDKPLMTRYGYYLRNLTKGDLGSSIRTHRPVLTDLKEYFPATMELALFSTTLAVVFGVLFGVVSARKRNSLLDQGLRGFSVIGVSAPTFWLALLFLFVFYYKLGWAPGLGRLSFGYTPPDPITNFYVLDAALQGEWSLAFDALSHLVLPGIVLALFTMGLITRTTRSNILEVMTMDYIRTARAKGLSWSAVTNRHALGNAMIPVITVISVGFENLLGGTVLVETIFSWPGIGQYAYKSATSLDFPAITGVSLLIAVIYIVINLIIDLLYGLLDPRVKYE